jgi:class 3 adenylate cyclase
MPELPTGTVTLLFTDVEGSTTLLEEVGRLRYIEVFSAYQRLARETFARHGGVEVEAQGDSFHYAFAFAREAIAAAAALQRSLTDEDWAAEGLRVRIGVHTCEPAAAEGRYAGLDVHRAARIMSAGHGGQVLLSDRTADLVEEDLPERVSLRDLGQHRLKGLSRLQRLYQLVLDDLPTEFPALRTLDEQPTPKASLAIAEAVPEELGSQANAATDAVERHIKLRAFLLADVRGYTRFTQEHGDAAASRLAQRFADIVRGAIASSGGELVELRGDEALCVFSSAREALSAAIELQRRCRAGVDGERALPLGIGVGLDAGEAVPTEGGYRGGALNVAARLCALARPGEILASETVTSLAGRHEGARYGPRRAVRLKGLEQPIRHSEVIPGIPLPPLPPAPSKLRASRVRRRWASAAALAVALSAVAFVAVLISRGGGGPALVPAGSLAAIDPKTNSGLWHVSVGENPTEIAVSGGKVWILNRGQTMSLVDAGTRSLIKTFAIGAAPAGIAAGASGVWAGDSVTSSVLKLNPDNAVVIAKIHAPPLTPPPLPPDAAPRLDGGSIALSHDAMWFLSGNATLSRIEPRAGHVQATVRHGGEPDGGPAYVAVGEDGVWVYAYNGTDGDLTRVDPRSNSVVASVSLAGTGPLAAGLGNVWLVDNPKHLIWQIDPGSPTARPPTVVRSITVGQNPVDVAVGLDSVWVASGDGTVSRIDPIAARVVETIRVGGNLGGIAVGGGLVWVTVD